MRTELNQRWAVRETLLALLVVTLTFLNFGHSSAVFAAGGRVVVTGHAICGDQGAVNDGEHFACHACRPTLADLPPPPAEPEPVCFVTTAVSFAAALPSNDSSAGLLAFAPRGPPVSA
jgi:hypothetical protein